MTQDEMLLMKLRKNDLRKELKRIEDTVTGRNFRFLPFITDENGNISNELIDSFISDLLSPINDPKFMKKDGELFRPRTEADIAFYRSFLYCAMTGFAGYEDEYDPEVFISVDREDLLAERLSENFADIIALTEGLERYQSADDLAIAESDSTLLLISEKLRLLCPFVIFANRMYYCIKGEAIEVVPDYPEDPDPGSTPEPDFDPEYEPTYTIPDWMDEVEDEVTKSTYLESVGQKEINDDEWDEYLADIQKAVDHSFRHSFDHLPDKDRFIKEYMDLRERLDKADTSRLSSDIERLVDLFLYKKGISAFSLGEEYGLITYKLRRTEQYISCKICEGGKAE